MQNPARISIWLTAASVALLALVLGGAAHAAMSKEILQAVKNGVPNSGDNRVVMAEITAGDW